MNNCESIRREIESISQSRLVESVQLLEASHSLVKARLMISKDLFMQVYRNDKFNTTNFSLILGRHRVYGRDEIKGEWHRHPLTDPERHDRSAEGLKEMDLMGFWEEVKEILHEKRWVI